MGIGIVESPELWEEFNSFAKFYRLYWMLATFQGICNMPVSTDPIVPCPGCKRSFRWSLELAGCAVQCPCGQSFKMPFNNPAEDDVYDLEEPVAPPARPPATVAPKSAERVLAYQPRSLNPTKVDLIKDASARALADTTMQAMALPLVLLVIGLLARFAIVFLK